VTVLGDGSDEERMQVLVGVLLFVLTIGCALWSFDQSWLENLLGGGEL
jgi:hypothetical protein